VTVRVQELIAQRQLFVIATVVRAGRPTSVRPGDSAVVLPDGSIDGFVGGVCAESSVRLQSLQALETGNPLLLRLVPGDDDQTDSPAAIDGAVVLRNPCWSGPAARRSARGAHRYRDDADRPASDAPLAACGYENGRGHPLMFGKPMFDELANLHGDKGYWKLIDRHEGDVVDVPVASKVPLDVDTWADYESVLAAR
jgi:XdhC and CoxI family